MQTRREIIKGGLGLATILAVGESPAIIKKSLIAGRATMLGGKKAPTAKDYIQDGLIAMWDGIENAGWGVHDAAATTWVNLKGGPSMSFNGDLMVGDDHMRTTSGYGQAAFASALSSTDLTIEFVAARYFKYNTKNAFYSESVNETDYGGYSSIFFYANSGQIYYNRTPLQWYVASSLFPWGVPRHFSFSVGGGNAQAIMGNAVLKEGPMDARTQTVYGVRTTYTAGSDKALYCIRRYSRALTADEIAANYAIDKARFNLP